MNSKREYVDSEANARWGFLRLPGAMRTIMTRWTYTVKG